MRIKVANPSYLDQAKQLSEEETERILSRMGGKLRRKKDKEKVDCLEAIAIQLEIEDEMLREWRERFAEIKARHEKKAAAAEPVDAEPVADLAPHQPKKKAAASPNVKKAAPAAADKSKTKKS